MKDKKITLRKYLLNKKLILLDLFVRCSDKARKETMTNELQIINDILKICEERGHY